MDDLKVYAKSSNALDTTLQVVDSVTCGRDGVGAHEVCGRSCQTWEVRQRGKLTSAGGEDD